jgi:hypothetical protein
MILPLYLLLLAGACVVASNNWRRGWLLLPVFAILQDPVRKMTAGTPVVLSFSIMAIYAAVLFSARATLAAHLRELNRRFPALFTAISLLALFIVLGTVNGFFTFGAEHWRVPLLSLGLYVAPLPAVIVGYAFLQREEDLYRFFRLYAVITSIALIGTLLEYWRVKVPGLGIVALPFDYYRHFFGIQVRLLSGFYRAPDIMAWHAAMLTSIGLVMTLRPGSNRLIWMGVAGWGFLNCLLSGRRKATYFVLSFAAVMVWRYFRRLQAKQVLAVIAAIILVGLIVQNVAAGRESNVYVRGAKTSRAEILFRLGGGVIETFRQFGLLGAGLGAATQGTRHLPGGTKAVGWQEGGLGKLAVELGLPGLLAVVLFAVILMRLLLRLTAIGDVPGSTQFTRVALFSFFVANATGFMASAQAYTDGMLALTTAFLAGCLLATAALDERLTAPETQPALAQPQPARA